jgi:hypothetical protein
MVFGTPLNNMSHLYRGVQFYWSRKPEYPETATVMSLTNLSHNVASSTPRHQWDNIKFKIMTYITITDGHVTIFQIR